MTKVVVTTAVELTADQLEQIKKVVVKKYGKDVTFETKISPDLIGGVQITIGSRQLDGSIKGKLDQIRQKLALSK